LHIVFVIGKCTKFLGGIFCEENFGGDESFWGDFPGKILHGGIYQNLYTDFLLFVVLSFWLLNFTYGEKVLWELPW